MSSLKRKFARKISLMDADIETRDLKKIKGLHPSFIAYAKTKGVSITYPALPKVTWPKNANDRLIQDRANHVNDTIRKEGQILAPSLPDQRRTASLPFLLSTSTVTSARGSRAATQRSKALVLVVWAKPSPPAATLNLLSWSSCTPSLALYSSSELGVEGAKVYNDFREAHRRDLQRRCIGCDGPVQSQLRPQASTPSSAAQLRRQWNETFRSRPMMATRLCLSSSPTG